MQMYFREICLDSGEIQMNFRRIYVAFCEIQMKFKEIYADFSDINWDSDTIHVDFVKIVDFLIIHSNSTKIHIRDLPQNRLAFAEIHLYLVKIYLDFAEIHLVSPKSTWISLNFLWISNMEIESKRSGIQHNPFGNLHVNPGQKSISIFVGSAI